MLKSQRHFWERFVLAKRGPALRYGVALLLAGGSLLLLHALNRLENVQLPSLAFAGVVLAAIYGGLGPALLNAAVTTLGVDYLFVAPLSQVLDSWTSLIRVLTYAAIGVLIASIVSSMREAYRELHAQYRKAELEKRARENILAIVSHDLRSPLSAILMSVTYLKRAAKGEMPALSQADVLDGVHRSADRMRRLVDDLLDATNIEAGKLAIATARHDVAAIIEDAMETVRFAATAKDVRVALNAPEGGHPLTCDRDRLTQVLSNLIGNAIKFSPDAGVVEVTLEVTDESLKVAVRDSGPGISGAHLPHLFTPYWQAAETAHLGTGLGLYIARNIVEAHRGRIEVDSRAGAGTTFSITLPR